MQSPGQSFFLNSLHSLGFLRTAANIRTQCLVVLTHLRVRRQALFRWPNSLSLFFLALVMLDKNLADRVLEKERRFLVLGVQRAVDENASLDVLLCIGAEDLILGHHARIHVIDQLEVRLSGVSVPVDLVGHLRLGGTGGEELLDHDKMRPRSVGQLIGSVLGFKIHRPRGTATYVTTIAVIGK